MVMIEPKTTIELGKKPRLFFHKFAGLLFFLSILQSILVIFLVSSIIKNPSGFNEQTALAEINTATLQAVCLAILSCASALLDISRRSTPDTTEPYAALNPSAENGSGNLKTGDG